MPPDPFRSSWEKLDRAEHHFQELRRLIDEFAVQLEASGDLLFTFEQKYMPRSHCIRWTIADVQPADVEWGIVLGDVLHNLRCALDHAAWRLVEAGKRPPQTLTQVEQAAVRFPIYKVRTSFNHATKVAGKKDSCLPGVSRGQVAFIRQYQPYRAGRRRSHLHPFAILQQFSNDDKHRTVQLAFFRPFDPEFVIGEATDFIPTKVGPRKIVIGPDPGTEVLRIYGRRTGPNPHMDLRIRSSAEPAIEGRYWLSDTYLFAKSLIESLLYRLAPTVR